MLCQSVSLGRSVGIVLFCGERAACKILFRHVETGERADGGRAGGRLISCGGSGGYFGRAKDMEEEEERTTLRQYAGVREA